MSLTWLLCAEPLWKQVSSGSLDSDTEAFWLVSAPAVAVNVSYWTCKVIPQWGAVWGSSPYNPSVLCFPDCYSPFQRALIQSADTWEPSAASSQEGDTLTGRGIRADWPPTLPECHFIASWQKQSEPAHTHTCTHEKHTEHLRPQPNHKDTPTSSSEAAHRPAVSTSVDHKVPNLCWHTPSIWGYQQMQTLVQSGMRISAPVQRTHKCRRIKEKEHAKFYVSFILYLPALILSSWRNTEH